MTRTTPPIASPDSPADGWQPDLLPGYEQLSLPLAAAPEEGEPDAPLTATLVRHPADAHQPDALLYLHGWNDFFFQAEMADRLAPLGAAFYALDLRRYGRSLRPDQLAGYIGDFADYAEEIDAALDVIVASHRSVTLLGHSTGGLVACEYALLRPHRLAGLMLNAPWLDFGGSPWVRALLPAFGQLGAVRPLTVIPGRSDPGVYWTTLHTSEHGEWDYDRELKSSARFIARAGWLRAVLAAQRTMAGGLGLDLPVLCLTSARSLVAAEWTEAAQQADLVLDVDAIAEVATKLAASVHLERIDGGLHDLALSAEPARSAYYAAIARWWHAYGAGS